ncbi:MAG TPA: malonate decarboxylase holo-[acyl-carrier-protein] synthase [Candidatus Sulfotelmatobacter sp.]|jgi:phosphoribosyl-dephospho-CoA transferase|nr:malonate decarboxylase holo-[acyl-carrier-protein] synthase [Candidatus Sulfotelmatobacter sp.]
MPKAERFQRHDWVWLDKTWPDQLIAPILPPTRYALDRWLEAGRPLVVARRLPGDGDDTLRLGLAQPNRGRLSLHLRQDALVSSTLSPSPSQVKSSSPEDWHETLDWLERLGRGTGTGIGVYGSLAWQHFADDPDLRFLSPSSDLDLLFRPAAWPSVERLLRELSGDGRHAPAPRLDGEIILPDGAGVSWRELAARPPRLLVKSMDEAALRPLAQVMSQFGRRAA